MKWKDIAGYEGLYQCSNTGLIKSFKRSGSKGSVLKTYKRKKYNGVTLSKGNARKVFNVHRLVALTFMPKIKGYNFVNHKDGDTKNNNVNNLEWVTPRKNIEHSINELGNDAKGERNGNSRLTEREVRFLRWIKSKFPDLKAFDVSKFYNMSDVNIYDIWNKKKWKHL